MITETEKAWLAGFWDGEGSITIFTHVEKNGKKKICPTINVTNTHEGVIAHTVELLDRLGTSFSILEKRSDTDKHKTAYTIGTRNISYIKTTLEAMQPYLVCKKAQCALVLRYVNKKLQQREANGRPRYDDEDFDIQEECQLLNKRGKVPLSSTTTREADQESDDIV
jgi:hypothetical protein